MRPTSHGTHGPDGSPFAGGPPGVVTTPALTRGTVSPTIGRRRDLPHRHGTDMTIAATPTPSGRSPVAFLRRHRVRLAYTAAGGAGLLAAFAWGNPDDWKLEPMCNRLGQHWMHHGEWFHRAGDAADPVLVCVSGSGGPQWFLKETLPR